MNNIKKSKEKEKEMLLKNKTEEGSPLKEVVEFDDKDCEIIKDLSVKPINK